VAVSGPEPGGEYQRIFDALPVAAGIVDRNGDIAWVNRALERQFGYNGIELAGLDVGVLLPNAVEAIHGTVRGPGEHDTGHATSPRRQVPARRHDGSEFCAEIDVRPFETPTGEFLILSIAEVTDRHRAEMDAPLTAVEVLVADLSAQFTSLAAERIADATRSGLQRVCRVLSLERATLLRIESHGTPACHVEATAGDAGAIDPVAVNAELFPWTFERLMSEHLVCFASPDEVPDEIDRRNYRARGTPASLLVPLLLDGQVGAVAAFSAGRMAGGWPPDVVHDLSAIASVFAQGMARQQRDELLEGAVEEANRLTSQLQARSVFVRHDAQDRSGRVQIVGNSDALRHVMEQAARVAPTDSTVLLLGETGTGKELFASYIHSLSSRRGRPMVRVNCAAIPATLIESELFGREKGAFTGALARQVGRFELADHSTIFLDEIGDLPVELQVKLLRVLEERKFERLGSPRPIALDTRIICATHRSLEQRIAEGAFREDLYYRLNVFPIQVPPLRERLQDVPALVYKLLEEFSKNFGKRIDVVDRESLLALQRYSWPGNIRELRNVVERAMIVATSQELTIPLPESPAAGPSLLSSPKLVDVEREHILAVLKGSAWRIRGVGGAANRLGMKPTTLETRMAKLGLKRPDHL
jgi:PAS domain S-box-containing protein